MDFFTSTNVPPPQMGGVTDSHLMLVKPEQPENERSPILVTLLGIVTLVRPWQFQKAQFPMLVTLLDIVMDFRPTHSWKAKSPILITPLGIVTLVKLLHR